MTRYIIGIDIARRHARGSGRRYGAVLASATHEHLPFASPQNGWAEQDPHDWWKRASKRWRGSSRKARPKNGDCGDWPDGANARAILLDENDEVLRPALIWCDQRTQEECDELDRAVGTKRLVELTSNPALTNFTLTKLMWVRTHEPEIWKRFRSFFCRRTTFDCN